MVLVFTKPDSNRRMVSTGNDYNNNEGAVGSSPNNSSNNEHEDGPNPNGSMENNDNTFQDEGTNQGNQGDIENKNEEEEEEEVDENAFSLALGPPPSAEESVSLLLSSQAMRQDIAELQREMYMIKRMMPGASSSGFRPGGSSAMRPSISDGRPEQPQGSTQSVRGIFGNWFGDDDDEDLYEVLPEDSFSVMMVSKWSSFPFFSSVVVFSVQVATFLLLTLNELSNNATSENPLGVPVSVIPAVRITQIIAITITVFTQDDVRTGVSLFYKGYPNRVNPYLMKHLGKTKFVVITFMRIIEGSLGLLVTFLLIVSASTVIDLLLNFTAMEFVSQLVSLT